MHQISAKYMEQNIPCFPLLSRHTYQLVIFYFFPYDIIVPFTKVYPALGFSWKKVAISIFRSQKSMASFLVIPYQTVYTEVSAKVEASKIIGRRVSTSGMLKFLGVSRSRYRAFLTEKFLLPCSAKRLLRKKSEKFMTNPSRITVRQKSSSGHSLRR